MMPMQTFQHTMNTTASDIAREHDQKSARAASHAADSASIPQSEAQRQLEMDFEALREREANLRRYEARLRGWQEQLDARAGNTGGSGDGALFGNAPDHTSVESDAELCAAWDKFHRARALLQAEQNQLRDDRMAQHDNLLEIKRREEELAAREKRLAERELLLTIAVGAQEEKKESSLKRIKSVFSSSK